MRAALYLSIWASMIALAVSELARHRGMRVGALSPLVLSALGLAALVIHIAIAIFHHHGGDHAAAVAETARLTEQVYGVAWGGGVYVNYAFVAAWAAYVWWWWTHAEPLDNTTPWLLAIRAALFVIIFNALVVFASPLTRPLGVVLCLVLFWSWRPGAARAAVRTR